MLIPIGAREGYVYRSSTYKLAGISREHRTWDVTAWIVRFENNLNWTMAWQWRDLNGLPRHVDVRPPCKMYFANGEHSPSHRGFTTGAQGLNCGTE